MGRTIPPWRIIVDQELAKLSKFKQFLRAEDQIVFEDLLNQCKLYAQPPESHFISKGIPTTVRDTLRASQENH